MQKATLLMDHHKLLKDEIFLSLALGLAIFFFIGCSEGPQAPQIQLTGPGHVMVGPDTEEPKIVEISRLRQVLADAGYGREATAKALAQAQRQRQAYQAGVGRGRHKAQAKGRLSQDVITAARVIYSETKDRAVMSYVASTIRARLESELYPDDLWQVVTQTGQYSGYDSPEDRRQLKRLTAESRSRSFQQAIRAAWFALNAPREMLPAEARATHFIHVDTQRRLGREMPSWAHAYPEQFRAYDDSGQSKVVFYRKPS